MSNAVAPPAASSPRRLDDLVWIDPETLQIGTSPDFSFFYIDISSIVGGQVLPPANETRFGEAPSRARRVVRDGDVLMSTVRPNLKAFARCRLEQGNYVASTGFAVLRPKPGVDPQFVLSCLFSDEVAQQIERYVVGSNYPAINSSDVRRLKLPSFGEDEQTRIGAVLTSIDEAIDQTEALIAKYEQIRAGMMQDLFARGVLPDGSLRPSHQEAPQLYEETALGWLPRDWEITNLRGCLMAAPTNGIYKPASQIGTGTLLLGQTAIMTDRIIDLNLARRAEVTGDELRHFGLQADDLLISRVFATVEGVGQPALVPALPEPAVFESNMMRLRCDSGVLRPRLLFEWMRTDFVRRQVSAGVNASNQTSLNQRGLNSIPVPLPKMEEQQVLLAAIDTIDLHREHERATLNKLIHLRKGLMHDLLTGEVRLTVRESVTANV